MDALIVYPENKEQLTALKAVMKAMKIAFEQKSEVYPEKVVQGVRESLKQAENGELTVLQELKILIKSSKKAFQSKSKGFRSNKKSKTTPAAYRAAF